MHTPSTLQAVGTILDVLCGITAKEEDEAVREALAEAVLCVARHGGARKALWKCDAPTTLQKGCARRLACRRLLLLPPVRALSGCLWTQ